MIMSYKVSENKKAEWKEQAKENQNQARELICQSVSPIQKIRKKWQKY